MLLPLLIFIVSLLAFSFRLNAYPLMNWDEAWYGEIVKNLASGKSGWLVPFWNGQYYFDKPPLYFWLAAPVVRLFGLGEWQIRLVAVIAGALAVLLTYLIAHHLFGKKAALISSAVFISLGQIWFRFSSADLDSLQVFVFLAAIFFFLRAKKARSSLVLSGIFLGLSFLVKSWLLGLFPFFFLSVYSFFIDRSLRRYLVPVFLLSLLFGGWWYLAGATIYGKEFISWYLLSPGAGNFHSGVNYFTWYYFKIIISDFGFWLVPLFSFFLFKAGKDKQIKVSLLVVAFSLLLIGVLQLSADKFNWYLLPLYPLLALVVGQLFSRVDLSKSKLFLLLLVLSFAGQFISSYYSIRHDPDRSRVGADLGKFVSQKTALDKNVILDDKDFPSFIYYSNLGHVIVAAIDGGKSREPWIVSYQNLQKLNRPFWIITANWQKLNLGLPKEIINAPYNYRLVKFDTWGTKP